MASGSSLSLARRVTVANCSSSSCKRSSRYWSLFGLIARGRACSRLSAANFYRQQVVVEVAELPRALDPDVAGAQGVLQLGQGADFVEFPVEAFRVITSGFQRGLMKAVGASTGTLRRLSAFISRRVCTAASTPCALARRAVPAPPARPACNGAGWRSSRRPGAGGRSLPTGQQLGLADALGELVPGNHRLDGGIGVAAAFLRFQQRLADPGVQAHLVVDRLALLLNCC